MQRQTVQTADIRLDLPPDIDLAGGGFFARMGCASRVPLQTHPVRVALDCSREHGAKHHSGLPSGADLKRFVEWFGTTPNRLRARDSPSCLYEVVDNMSTTTRLALDLDREFHPDEVQGGKVALKAARRATNEAVLSVAEELLRKLSRNPGLQLRPGINCQLSESKYNVRVKNKLSTHAVFYAHCSWEVCKQFAYLLAAHIMQLPVGDGRRQLLFDADGSCGAGSRGFGLSAVTHIQQKSCIVDLTIYTNFRNMRLLYNCKMRYGVPLLPALGSSDRVEDHFACYYPELQSADAEMITLHSEELVAALQQCSSASMKQPVSATLTRQPPRTQRRAQSEQLPPVWLPEELDALKRSLCDSADLAARLQVERVVLGNTYPARNGNTCNIYISPT